MDYSNTHETDWGRPLVVTLVDVLVQRTPVESPMGPVVEHVLKYEEECDLGRHESPRREWYLVSGHAKVGAHGVEEPDERGFAGNVCPQYHLGHLPHLRWGSLLCRLQFPFVKVWNLVDDEPWDTAAKVCDLESVGSTVSHLVKEKAHDTCGNDRIPHVDVVLGPHPLEPGQGGKVDSRVELTLGYCRVRDRELFSDHGSVLLKIVHGDGVHDGYGGLFSSLMHIYSPALGRILRRARGRTRTNNGMRVVVREMQLAKEVRAISVASLTSIVYLGSSHHTLHHVLKSHL